MGLLVVPLDATGETIVENGEVETYVVGCGLLPLEVRVAEAANLQSLEYSLRGVLIVTHHTAVGEVRKCEVGIF